MIGRLESSSFKIQHLGLIQVYSVLVDLGGEEVQIHRDRNSSYRISAVLGIFCGGVPSPLHTIGNCQALRLIIHCNLTPNLGY